MYALVSLTTLILPTHHSLWASRATGIPVSLPLQPTLPPPGSTILPASILPALPYGPQSNNTTRILLLSDFSPELKTRDIQALFGEWEDDRGGFKIKWSDDVSCWIVFADPGVAKRAFLTLLASPPPALQPSPDHTPKLTPYTGADVPNILSAVQNRPRSRSNASSMNGGHSRKGSLLGSGGGGNLNLGGGAGGGGGHGRSLSYGRGDGMRGSRGSFGQKQMKEMMDGGANGEGGANGDAPPVPAIPGHLANGENGSPTDERRGLGLGEEGRVSPQSGRGHGRTDSRSTEVPATISE
ncbi:hypothetical protein MNV49_007550 [Pseudohyphozyma bogoriensis]|nr:hypothetical protein MNV49_007550 [Pseudohyphozyma bogoriensis]